MAAVHSVASGHGWMQGGSGGGCEPEDHARAACVKTSVLTVGEIGSELSSAQ